MRRRLLRVTFLILKDKAEHITTQREMADVLHGKNMTGKHQYQSLFLTKLDPACNFIK